MGYLPACIETLEDRRLFSVSFIKHVLYIQAPGGRPNTIILGLAPDGQSVTASLSYPWRKSSRTIDLDVALSAGIRLIHINGGRVADTITVDQTNSSFPVPTQIITHNGRDTINCGDEPDKIQCAGGAEVINTGNGNDTVVAGRGHEIISVGEGNSIIRAGQGHDVIVAGNGSNRFVDPFGHTTITAGSGPDTYVLKNIALDTTNYNPAKDSLQKYVPPKAAGQSLTDQIVGDVLDYLL